MNESIDPKIKALVSAIGEAETGPSSPDAYTKKGKSGEFGRYQFMPDTYKKYAQKYLGDSNAQPSIENQNKIVYSFVKEKKDQGFNPAQIASMWNAGEGKPNAYKEDHRGVNAQGVQFDTPSYAQKVSNNYTQLKGGGVVSTPAAVSSPVQDVPMKPQEKGFISSMGETLTKAGQGISTAVNKGINKEINPISSVLQTVGAGIGGVTGLATDILEHTPIVGRVVRKAEDVIGKEVANLAQTGVGQKVTEKVQGFIEKHPEAAGNIGAIGNIASIVPVVQGARTAGSIVKKGLVGGVNEAIEMVAPKLTAKETAEAIAQRGTSQKGLLRKTVLNEDPQIAKLAEVVTTNVPKFNPSKGLLFNVNETKKAVSSMAKKLKEDVIKGGQDRIYSFKELSSRLNSLEKPLLIASDTTLNNAYDRVVKKMIEIAKKKGGKVSNLLDTRQDFDMFIKKQFPNLYNSDNLTPMRQAIKDIRNEMNEFTAENLPEELGFRKSLITQHQLLNAIENMAEKASSGKAKEIGTDVMDRFISKHPKVTGLIKSGAKGGALITGFKIGD